MVCVAIFVSYYYVCVAFNASRTCSKMRCIIVPFLLTWYPTIWTNFHVFFLFFFVFCNLSTQFVVVKNLFHLVASFIAQPCVNNQWTTMNHVSLKGRPRCCAKLPTARNAFQTIPDLISMCWGSQKVNWHCYPCIHSAGSYQELPWRWLCHIPKVSREFLGRCALVVVDYM